MSVQRQIVHDAAPNRANASQPAKGKPMPQVSLSPDGHQLSLQTADATLRFHAVWLRHNALDADTRDQNNGQRLITLADLPDDCTLAAAETTDTSATVTFTDGKTTAFPIAWQRSVASAV